MPVCLGPDPRIPGAKDETFTIGVVPGGDRDDRSSALCQCGAEKMNQQLGGVRALLWFSLGWGLLLVLLSFVMPIATESSGYDGRQQRISAFHA